MKRVLCNLNCEKKTKCQRYIINDLKSSRRMHVMSKKNVFILTNILLLEHGISVLAWLENKPDLNSNEHYLISSHQQFRHRYQQYWVEEPIY